MRPHPKQKIITPGGISCELKLQRNRHKLTLFEDQMSISYQPLKKIC
jgi:hypothetical protein